MTNTTNTSANTEPAAKPKGIPSMQELDLRDYFAAKAMQGLLSCPVQPQSGADIFARDAYTIADAMLRAREENDQS